MTEISYPAARAVDVVDDFHGTKVADPYRWLEDSDAEDTRAWIAEQNRLTADWLGAVAERDTIRDRLQELWDHPRASAPSRRGGRWFQLRNSGLQDQDVLYVMDDPAADGRVLVDPNTLSEEGTVALTGVAASRDARLLAYAVSAAGSDWQTWRVRRIDTGQDLGDEVTWAKFSGAAWLPDGSGFFYGGYDEPRPGQEYETTNRNHRIRLHRLGTSCADDVVAYERPDQPEWLFAPSVTEDGRFLLLHVAHGTERRNRVFYRDLEAGLGSPVVELLAEGDAAYSVIGNDGPVFFVLTDAGAERGRVVAIDTRAPGREHWRELVAEHPTDTLERVQLVGGRWAGDAVDLSGARFVAAYLHHARARLARFTLDGAHDGDIGLPDIGAVGGMAGRPTDDAAYFEFATFTQPTAIYRHDVASGETALVRPPGLDLDQDRFVTEQRFARSADGTRVPVFCVHRRDVEPDSDVPVLLWGYGGFQIPVTPMFRTWWFVWLELGGLLAIPNLRGGGEYGQQWHDAGRLDRKQNTFDDCIAVAEALVAWGWTRPERLALSGASNGGLLVGACMTQRPDLFGACVPEVGVLDMLRFHRFTIGWAWASDYGAADDPDQFGWLHAYSPLHNVRPGVDYPATLVTTGDHDDRVVPGHSFKFAATLQAAQSSGGTSADGRRPALIRIQTQAGHGAGKPTRFLIEERADVLAFLVRALGIEPRWSER